MENESIKLEYKAQYTEDVRKEVIAFANTQGGNIYIGINDDKQVIGLENAENVLLQVTNSIRDSIRPDITMFVKCQTEIKEGKNITVIHVQKGTASPYYLAGKGIRPEGVYVRQGSSSVPASESAILKMIKESSGDVYEQNRSLEQNLTFDTLKKEFQGQNIPLEQIQMKTLGIIEQDGQYSNLALLLSEQCQHTIKLAVFEDTSKIIFKDRHEFTGSLLAQMRDCFTFIDRYNSTSSHIDGLTRTDTRDYPISAIREALLNLLVHRDYAYSASSSVNIYADKIEFLTVGGLVKGISMNDILLGVSMLRNKNLANIFYRLKLIEAYGTGIAKIMDCYAQSSLTPLIEVSDNAFKITLYNTQFKGNSIAMQAISRLSEKEERILELFNNNDSITRSDVQTHLNIAQATAVNYIKKLQEKNIIAAVGIGRNMRYELKNKENRLN